MLFIKNEDKDKDVDFDAEDDPPKTYTHPKSCKEPHSHSGLIFLQNKLQNRFSIFFVRH